MPKTSDKLGKARILSSRRVFSGPVFSVTSDRVIEPGGLRVRRDIVHHPGSVVVLAIEESHDQPRVLLERQYRHAAQDYLWELPAGRIDPGEDELAAAQRELWEETGYRADRWRAAFKYFASPGFMDETMAVYLARGLHRGQAQPEQDEVIRKRFFPVSGAIQMVMGGKIRDGKTIAGVLWFQQHRKC